MDASIEFIHLGRKPFAEVLQLQLELRKRRQSQEIPDTVVTVEHPRVITRGRRPAEEDFRIAPEQLRAQGFAVEDAGRGGRLTYHGPGQLVGYFIMSLTEHRLSVPAFVHRVEEAVILTLGRFGIPAGRREEYPGVWTGQRKIGSIGLTVDRGVSMNGIALNVDPDLNDFKVIVPCGIPECEMTSMKQETDSVPNWEEVERVFCEQVLAVFA